MTTVDLDEAIVRKLRQLPILEPDTARMERVRTRCHAAMLGRQKRAKRPGSRGRVKTLLLEAALFAVFSLIYLCAVIYDLLRFSVVR